MIVKCLPASDPPPRDAFSPGIKPPNLVILVGHELPT